MRINCSTKELKTALQQVTRIIKANSAIAVLQHVKIEAMNSGHIICSASDYDTEIEYLITGEVEHVGSITLPGKQFCDIVSHLLGEEVTVSATNHRNSTVCSGKSKYKLNGFEPDSFPRLPELDDPWCVTLPQSTLKDMVLKCDFAIGNDELRPSMCGAWFQRRDGALLCRTTDAHRACFYKYQIDSEESGVTSAIVPKQDFMGMERLLGWDDLPCWLEFDVTLFRLTGENFRLKARLLPYGFPDCDRLLSESRPIVIFANRDNMIAAAKRLVPVSVSEVYRLRVKVDAEGLTLSARDEGTGEGDEGISIEGEGGDVEFFVNGKYLIDALSVIDGETVKIEVASDLRPICFSPLVCDNYKSVIMPLTAW